MKAEELRLGNLIRYGNPIHKDLPIHKITGIMAHSFWLDGSVVSSENSNVIGIPLTEEWLLKFGFETDTITFDKMNFRIGHFAGVNEFIWLPNGSLNSHKYGVILTFAHQLQNLFYALTGQELTLKP